MFEESEPQLPTGMALPRLRLESSRAFYKQADKWPLWAKFIWLGILWGVEDLVISAKATIAVDKALEALPEEPVVVAPPIYTEKPPSPTSGGLPSEMRLRAPWIKE